MSNTTILDVLGKPNGIKNMGIYLDENGDLALKKMTCTKIAKRNINRFFQSKQTRLQRIELRIGTLQHIIHQDIQNRHGLVRSDAGFNIDVATKNVKTLIEALKYQAKELSSEKEDKTISFGSNGAQKTHSDALVDSTTGTIDEIGGDILVQINRLRPRKLSNRAIHFFSRNPKDIQIKALTNKLKEIENNLKICPKSSNLYPRLERKQAGLEYTIQQLEMNVPTYESDIKLLLKDLNWDENQFNSYQTISDKLDLINRELTNHRSSGTQKRLKDLKTLIEAKELIEVPLNQEMARIQKQFGGASLVDESSIRNAGYDFATNSISSYVKAGIRGGVGYVIMNGMPSILSESAGAVGSGVFGSLGLAGTIVRGVLPYAIPVIMAKPDLVGRFIPRPVKEYFQGSYIEKVFS